MSELTTDPNDPRLTRGADSKPAPQAPVYLVLSEEERRKGFVRPVRLSYRHVGEAGPKYPLRDATPEEKERYAPFKYIKFEAYPNPEVAGVLGKWWTQADLDSVNKGCGSVTTMSAPLAETYARDPKFYGSTYCVTCRMHRPVSEFVWEGSDDRVGS
jgi:hypothetical protein